MPLLSSFGFNGYAQTDPSHSSLSAHYQTHAKVVWATWETTVILTGSHNDHFRVIYSSFLLRQDNNRLIVWGHDPFRGRIAEACPFVPKQIVGQSTQAMAAIDPAGNISCYWLDPALQACDLVSEGVVMAAIQNHANELLLATGTYPCRLVNTTTSGSFYIDVRNVLKSMKSSASI